MSERSAYTLESSDKERARLARQAQKLRPLTERLFRAAGIRTGMSVLDAGCGGGDVSLLVAELVGDAGTVLGFDRDRGQVDGALARAAGRSNLRFVVAELDEPPEGHFDAIVGRLVLMYQPDLERTVAHLAARLRPGGVMAFVEANIGMNGPLTLQWPPQSALDQAVSGWIGSGFAATQTQRLVGLRLPSLYRSAGLVSQEPYDSGWIVYEGRESAEMAASLVRAMLPVLERDGVDVAEISIDTLADRIHAQHGDERISAVGAMSGVWARKPTD